MYGFQNPYMPGFSQFGQNYSPVQNMTQATQVVRVNGRNGAEAYTIGPNSSALLLDESGTLVWLVTSDGAGYKTVSAYDIAPHQTAPAPDFGSLEMRISKLEAIINERTADTSTASRNKSSGGEYAPDKEYDRDDQRRWQSSGHDSKYGPE